MSGRASGPFIRLYDSERDHENVLHVFRETCDDALRTEPLWTIGEYVWCRPYLFLSPATCLVLDDGTGTAVGYIIGTSNSEEFCARWKAEFVPSVEERIEGLAAHDVGDEREEDTKIRSRNTFTDLILHDPEKLVYGGFKSLLLEWPGHLHIDILPLYHRQGYGIGLILHFLEALRARGCSGTYLCMSGSNLGASAFYEASGFRRLPHILDDGASVEMGRTKKAENGGQQLYYVKDV